MSWLEINEPQQADVVRWIHLDHTARDSRSWLTTQSGLNEPIVDAMLETETRPRCLQTGEGILLVMRGVNLNPEAEFEDMVSIRVWLDSEVNSCHPILLRKSTRRQTVWSCSWKNWTLPANGPW